MSTPLQDVIAAATAEPPELPRLTTGMTFITYGRLGAQLSLAIDEHKRLPDATVQGCAEALATLIRNCEAAVLNAKRLLEANR